MALFFLLITIVQSWPLALNLSNQLFDLGDPADSVYRIGSVANNLRDYPLDFSRLYSTNAFYPVSNGLALDELLTGNALITAPLVWFTNNPVLAFNLLILTAYTLSGFAMWLLVRKLTGSSMAVLVAGIIYAFSPWHVGQYLHVGIANQGWMVLALYFLINFLETPVKLGRVINWQQIKYLLLFGICFVMQALYHKRPMINGSANILPTGYEWLLNELDTFPRPRSLNTLEGLQVQFVIVHRNSLSPRFRDLLDKYLSENNQLEVIYRAGDDLLLRLKPDNSLTEARQFIPKGAMVFLGEFSRYRSLYLHSLAGILGHDYNFVSPTRNIYSDALGIIPGRVETGYQYAFFYRKTDPTKYGYRAEQLIWENAEVALYYRPDFGEAAP